MDKYVFVYVTNQNAGNFSISFDNVLNCLQLQYYV